MATMVVNFHFPWSGWLNQGYWSLCLMEFPRLWWSLLISVLVFSCVVAVNRFCIRRFWLYCVVAISVDGDSPAEFEKKQRLFGYSM